jgi:hypothetical protein
MDLVLKYYLGGQHAIRFKPLSPVVFFQCTKWSFLWSLILCKKITTVVQRAFRYYRCRQMHMPRTDKKLIKHKIN